MTHPIDSEKKELTEVYLEQCQLEAIQLGSFLTEHLPLARAAEVHVDAYTGTQLIASAPLDKNINDKGTAFGGSLYNLCVIAGWGMAHLKAKELSLSGDIVVAKGEITYLSPLTEQLVAVALAPSDEKIAKAKHGYLSRGKAIFNIEVSIQNENKQPCVLFHGKYAVIAEKAL